MFVYQEDERFKPELVIMSTWDINNHYDNGICGHIYEVIEYFWLLKDTFNATFIFPGNIDLEECLKKYNFNEGEKSIILSAGRQRPHNGIVNTKHGIGLVLIVDGNLGNFKGIIRGIPVQFSCGKSGLFPNVDQAYLLNQQWYLLHDTRICPNIMEYFDPNAYISTKDTIKRFQSILPARIYPYNKKVLLSYLNENIEPSYSIINRTNQRTYMMYLTKNCRKLTPQQISEQLKLYEVDPIDKLLIFSDYETNKLDIDHPERNITQVVLYKPINIFDYEWTNYIYTPIERKWDCSNRLMVECMFHNRYFHDHKLDYEDKALLVRKYDTIETDIFRQEYGIFKQTKFYKKEILNLSKEDPITDILMDITNVEWEKRRHSKPFSSGFTGHYLGWGTYKEIDKCLHLKQKK